MACAAALLVVLLATAVPAYAMKHIVGGAAGWRPGFNYYAWSSNQTFNVGDTLLFRYNPSRHDVEEVSRSGYKSCTKSNKTYRDGNTSIALSRTGSRYFISGISNDCIKGMKLAVTVSGGISVPPMSSPSPSRSPAPVPIRGRVHGRSMLMRLVAYFRL